jgi:2'-5' RNA ligase
MRQSAFQELAKEVASLAMTYRPLTLATMALDVFGQEEKVDVYRLRASPELLELRAALVMWDKGTYSTYSPHVTIGPMGSAAINVVAPRYIAFDRILLSFGDTNLTFWLNK